MSKYNVMDLFSGVGGLSYGFSKIPDFNILAANEIEKEFTDLLIGVFQKEWKVFVQLY